MTELVVRRELVVPLQRARVRVQGDHRVAVEIVARARITVPVGAGISRSPMSKIEGRIIGARHPYGTSSALPRVALPGPTPGIAWSGDGVKAPDFAA
jgi:hypothetical protein